MKPRATTQIRVLPRSNRNDQGPGKYTAIALMLIGSVASLFIYLQTRPTSTKRKVVAPRPQETQHRVANQISQHVQDTVFRQKLIQRQRDVENKNAQMFSRSDTHAPIWLVDKAEEGVHLEYDETSDRLYQELNESVAPATEATLDERISARLANRKWVNEQERLERLGFIRRYILDAHERGYEVQIDQNLVVVGVRKTPQNRKLNIDEVLNRLAKQGQ